MPLESSVQASSRAMRSASVCVAEAPFRQSVRPPKVTHTSQRNLAFPPVVITIMAINPAINRIRAITGHLMRLFAMASASGEEIPHAPEFLVPLLHRLVQRQRGK